MSIKKAFTPYAVIHMLRQIQIAYSMRDQIEIQEKFPLLFYIVSLGSSRFLVKSTLPSSKSVETPGGLSNLTCSCPFFTTYALICWHQVAVLDKLQIKNINMFENLKRYRDVVGRKVVTARGEKKGASEYGVRKEKRLKSFIENISKKH